MAQNDIEDLNEQVNWHWRNSMRIVRFFSFDARAAILLPLVIFHIRLWTIGLFFFVLWIFNVIEKKGLTFPAALRKLRSDIWGRDRPGHAGVFRRKNKDFL